MKQLLTDALIAVTPGQTPAQNSSPSGWVANPANRHWTLTEAANAANLPKNPWRASVTVDCSQCGDAFVHIGTTTNPNETQAHSYVPAGAIKEFPVGFLGAGEVSVSLVADASAADPCMVVERSYTRESDLT